jgi:hypothetical protein
MGRFLALVSVVLLAASLFVWRLGTSNTTRVSTMSPDYARLVGRQRASPARSTSGAISCSSGKNLSTTAAPMTKGSKCSSHTRLSA